MTGNTPILKFTGTIEERNGIEALIYNIMDLNAQDTFDHNKLILSQDVELVNDDDHDEYEIIKYCHNTVTKIQ